MAETPEQLEERDSKTGRFLPGHKGMGGRPSIRTLRDALREAVDPDKVAKQLIARARKSDAVLMFVFNQLEGTPHSTSESKVEHTGAVSLKWQDGEQA